jgi:hypothetical protein
MMRRATAAAYLDMSEAAFEREITGGRLPMPVLFGGKEMWSRKLIDEAIERLTSQRAPNWRLTSKLYVEAAEEEGVSVEAYLARRDML